MSSGRFVFFVRLLAKGEETVKVLIQCGPQVLGLAHGRGTCGKLVGLDAQLDHTMRSDSMWCVVQDPESSNTGKEDIIADGEVSPMTMFGSGSKTSRFAVR
jgi:hypothetical protein